MPESRLQRTRRVRKELFTVKHLIAEAMRQIMADKIDGRTKAGRAAKKQQIETLNTLLETWNSDPWKL